MNDEPVSENDETGSGAPLASFDLQDLSRSDMRMIEKAINHQWDFTPEMFKVLPQAMLNIVARTQAPNNAQGEARTPSNRDDRQATSAMRTLARMVADNVKCMELVERIRGGGHQADQLQMMLIQIVQFVSQRDPALGHQLLGQVNQALPGVQGTPVIELELGDDMSVE